MRLRLRAPAKLNLVLEVLGRRSDGFHEIRSVVQPIALFDLLLAEPAATLTLTAPAASGPLEENLVLRTARLLQKTVGISSGAHIKLQKRIPVGAGLGGGSSDAAATLRLLSRLWRLRPGTAELPALASQVGSDVPLFLNAGAALLSGRGEEVQALPSIRAGWFVIVVPPWQEPGKTAAVYSAASPRDFGDGRLSQAVADRLRDGSALDPRLLRNGLEPAARRVFPALASFQQQLAERTASPFVLTGAGPALFSYIAEREAATAVAQLAQAVVPTVLLARPLRKLCTIRVSSGRSPVGGQLEQ